MSILPGELLRNARLEAGLSQRELAKRAGTTQSVVARIEMDIVSPGWNTLAGLFSAAGFELSASADPKPAIGTHMLDDVARILRLTPEQRLLELGNVSRFFAAAERV